MGQALDGYFPEILAADLDQSSALFALRRLTSGSPEPAFSSEDKFPNVAGHAGWTTRCPGSPSYRAALGPASSLGPIKEKRPLVSFLGNRVSQQRSQQQEDVVTDSESVSGTEVSKGAGAQSTTSRDRSLLTVATSLTASWISHLKNASPATSEPDRDRSWIDPDSEDDDEPANASQEILSSLSPRPPTPSEHKAKGPNASGCDTGTTNLNGRVRQMHQKAHSISAFVVSSSRPQRHNSTRSRKGRHSGSPPPPLGEDAAPPVPRQRPRASTFHTQHDQKEQDTMPRRAATVDIPQYEDFTLADHMSPRDNKAPDICEHCPSDELNHTPNEDFIRAPPPSSPMPSVESWLNNNAHSYAIHHTEDVFRPVPLPPNVMETLRISVTCFPETMLLTSSLTVETIRSYSKKVRQPTIDIQASLANMPISPSTGGIPGKSLWRKVASRAKNTSPLESARRLNSPGSPTPGHKALRTATGFEELDAQPQAWDHLKNIFSGASDYICDALWAHIIAYNYISAHVPRPRSPENSPESSPKDEIPKKAASLLGLASAAAAQDGQLRSLSKLTGPLTGLIHRHETVTEPPEGRRATAQETAMRDLQAGLMRCIARLIATAKLMVEDGKQDNPIMDVDMTEQGADLFLARSLCEIVRFSEDDAA